MRGSMVNFMKILAHGPAHRLRAAVVFGALGLALSGCVVYPSSYGYGYGRRLLFPHRAYYAPPVVVGVGRRLGLGPGLGRAVGVAGGHWH